MMKFVVALAIFASLSHAIGSISDDDHPAGDSSSETDAFLTANGAEHWTPSDEPIPETNTVLKEFGDFLEKYHLKPYLIQMVKTIVKEEVELPGYYRDLLDDSAEKRERLYKSISVLNKECEKIKDKMYDEEASEDEIIFFQDETFNVLQFLRENGTKEEFPMFTGFLEDDDKDFLLEYLEKQKSVTDDAFFDKVKTDRFLARNLNCALKIVYKSMEMVASLAEIFGQEPDFVAL